MKSFSKLILIALFCLSLFSFVSASISDGIVAHHKLNDNLATTNVIDNIGGYNGTASANTDTLDTTGKINGALNFNGVTDYASGTLFTTTSSNSVTVSAWVKVNSLTGTWQVPVRWGTENSGQIIDIAVGATTGTAQTLSCDKWAGSLSPYSTNINFSQWYHIVCTYNGTSLNQYVNGVYSGAWVGSIAITSSAYSLGSRAGGSALPFNGSIDDVRIYNRSLTQAEITELYNSGSGTEYDALTPWVDNGASTQNVQGCGVLNTTNATYNLVTNVTSTGTCFNITANNITINGNGFTIMYATSGTASTYGVYSNKNYTTVKNLNIVEGSASGAGKHAIYFLLANNGTVFNNTINTNGSGGSYGIHTYFNANFNNISFNFVNTTGQDGVGIGIRLATNNTVYNNTVYTISTRAYGIYLWDFASYTNVTNNFITTTSGTGHGIYVASTNYVTLINNYISSLVYGTYISTSSYANLSGNNINASTRPDYYIEGTTSAHYNHTVDSTNLAKGKPVNFTYNVQNQTYSGINYTTYGQVIFAYSNNISILNSNFSSEGLHLWRVNDSVVQNSTIDSTASWALFLYYSARNNLTSNNITSVGTEAYGILLSGATNNNISYSFINVSGSNAHGIYVAGNNNTIAFNTIYGYVYGSSIFTAWTDFTNIFNNYIVNSGRYALEANAANGNNINSRNNIYISLSEKTLYIYQGGSNSYFENDTMYCYATGITMGSVNIRNAGVVVGNLTFNRTKIYTNGSNTPAFSSFDGGANISLIDTILNASNSATKDFTINSATSPQYYINFTNVTRANGAPINYSWAAGATITLNFKNYADIFVNYTNGTAASGVNISAYDVNGNLVSSGLTDSSGNYRTILTNYKQNDSSGAVITYYNNYSINATTNYYPETSSVNMSANRNVYFTLDSTNPSGILTNPQNNTFANNGTQNFTANISDVGEGIKNATLNIYNSSNNLINQTSVTGFASSKALSFTPNSYGVIPNSTTLDLTSTGSLSVWFYSSVASQSAYAALICKRLNSGDGCPYAIDFSSSGNRIRTYLTTGSTYNQLLSNSTISQSAWTHAVSTWNGTLISLYINGVLVNTTAQIVNAQAGTGEVTLGAYRFSGGGYSGYYNGLMDEVLIFNRTLNSTEVSQIYNAGNGMYSSINSVPFNSGLVSGYHFDEGSGTSVSDLTGTNNGTLSGVSFVSGKISSTLATFNSGVLSSTVGVVVTLVDGIYKWFYNIFDFAGNNVQTANQTLTVDTIYPQYTFSAPLNNTYYNNLSVLFNLSTSSAPNASIIPNIDNSLVSWWRMDDTNSSGTLVRDYMNRNNGTAINGATQVTNGKFGKAMSFDGSNDYLNMGNSMNNITNNFTISLWIKASTLSQGNKYILSKLNSGGSNNVYSLLYGYHSNNLSFYASDQTGDGSGFYPSVSSDIPMADTGWHLITYSYNGSLLSGYRDGASIFSIQKTFSLATSSNYLYISAYNSGGNFFNGSLDDVMIFNRSLSSDEILSLYNATAYNHYETLGANANHTFNSYIQDFSGNINTTGAITFTVDTSQPNVSLLTPANNTFTNQTENINLTANLTDNMGIKNATLNLINTTDNSVTQTLIDVTSGSVQQTVGVVVSLVEGIYNWFINIFDLAGNQYNSQNSTLIIDTTYPLIEFDLSNPENLSGLSGVFNITAVINEKNIANVTLFFNNTNYIFDFANNSTYFALVSGDQYNFSVEKGPLGPMEQIYYNLTTMDKSGQQNSTETRLITGNTAPSLVSLTQTPNATALLDPLQPIFVNATLYDAQSNFESAWLQWKNSTQTWAEIIGTPQMITMATNGSADSIFVNASFALPDYEDNIQYRIFTNDTVGGEANLTVYNISNYYDCTWNISKAPGANLGQFFGWVVKENFANFTIYNTGDENYTGMCPLNFIVYHNLLTSGEGSLRIDDHFSPSWPYENVTAGETVDVKLYFTYRTQIYSDALNLTIEEDSGNADAHTDYLTSTLISTSGPYLYQEQLAPESQSSSNLIVARNSSYYEVYLSNQTILFNSSLRNGVGDGTVSKTAYNVTSSFLFNELFSFTNETSADNITSTNESISFLYSNISDGLAEEKHYSSLTLNLTSFLESINRSKNYLFELNSYGYNSSGSQIMHANNISVLNNSFIIKFLCYSTSDSYCVTQCDKDLLGVNATVFDPDCAYCGNGIVDAGETCSSCVADAGACASSVSGGGGGGGGGGGNEFGKSEATFELVRGEKQEFILTLENKLAVAKKNITIKVSGDNSEYVSFSPEVINYIGPNSAVNITVKITAPSYFAADRHLLRFDFAGDTIVNSTSVRFSEQKFVTLRILDISRTEINKMMNSSARIISEMNSSGFIISGVEELFAKMQTNYENYSFADLKTNYQQLDLIYKSAVESNKSIIEVGLNIADAEKRGLTVSETKKLLFLAEIMFKRGDYVLAAEKLKEAKLTFALETKGEFKLLYAIKNNPGETAGILVSAFLIGIGSSYVVRLRLLKRKLRVLAEEEQLLLQLMKVIQRDCFEGNKMSMDEYNEAMLQYEGRLSEVIQERIKSETLLANLMKMRGSRMALKQEKDRLVLLIRTAQEDYLNKGKLDTRIYENMLKTYGSRLSKIEEEMVFAEAQEAIKKVTGWKWFGRK